MNVQRILAATEDIITPVAVVDEEIVERNLARMAKLAADNNVKLRPHAKTHKSAYMAQRQMAHGAVGLTCATFTEAEIFADAVGTLWDEWNSNRAAAHLPSSRELLSINEQRVVVLRQTSNGSSLALVASPAFASSALLRSSRALSSCCSEWMHLKSIPTQCCIAVRSATGSFNTRIGILVLLWQFAIAIISRRMILGS